MRSLVTATIVAVVLIAIAVAGLVTAGVFGPTRPSDLPTPPASLRGRLTDVGLETWVGPGLVLAYTEGGVYHLFVEGVLPFSCPEGLPERSPESCFATAEHVTVGPGGETIRGSHELEIREPGIDADVLWRGSPDEGSIGIRSPGACARIERFDGDYKCEDGVPVYIGD